MLFLLISHFVIRKTKATSAGIRTTSASYQGTTFHTLEVIYFEQMTDMQRLTDEPGLVKRQQLSVIAFSLKSV